MSAPILWPKDFLLSELSDTEKELTRKKDFKNLFLCQLQFYGLKIFLLLKLSDTEKDFKNSFLCQFQFRGLKIFLLSELSDTEKELARKKAVQDFISASVAVPCQKFCRSQKND